MIFRYRCRTDVKPNHHLYCPGEKVIRVNVNFFYFRLRCFYFSDFCFPGIEADPGIVVTDADLEGPLPSSPQAGIDWLLVFSVVYVTSFIVYATMQTDRIRWLIPGQEHEHQD